MIITQVVTADQPAEAVFDYVSDFTTTTEWDPGTVRTVRTRGDGGIGTAYRNTSRFLGRTTELDYVVTAYRPAELIELRGENRALIARDTMTVRRLPGDRCELTYRAEFTFKGAWSPLAPLFAPALRRLARQGREGLRRALESRR